MPAKSLMFLTSALVSAGLMIEPLAANAAGLRQTGTWPAGQIRSVSNCDGVPVSLKDAHALSCRPGEAVSHFKDGMLKCTQARKLSDCTERTNLRKWGTGDMFFTYVARVCIDQRRETVGAVSQISPSSYQMSPEQRNMAAAAAKARELRLPGTTL